MAEHAPVVVAGTFIGLGDPVWNTPGGVRASLEDVVAMQATIVTPVNLEVGERLKPAEGGQPSFIGGTVGCDVIASDFSVPMDAGGEYVLFMTDALSGYALILDAWPIDGDGNVELPDGTVMSVDELAQALSGDTPAPTETAASG